MRTAPIFLLAIAVASTSALARPGITYQSRTVTAEGVAVTTIYAAGNSYRISFESSEHAPELIRQYPITVSNDGGKTTRAIRPANRTWYEQSNSGTKDITALHDGRPAIGENVKLLDPSVTFVEEASNERIEGYETRKFVTERYEGGALRNYQSTSEVIHLRCTDVKPSLFAIPPGYTYQEPVGGGATLYVSISSCFSTVSSGNLSRSQIRSTIG